MQLVNMVSATGISLEYFEVFILIRKVQDRQGQKESVLPLCRSCYSLLLYNVQETV